MGYFILLLAEEISEESSEGGALDDLKKIKDKIIPNDIWSFVIQLLATAILVFILAKFLVKPAKKFVEGRQKMIQKSIDESLELNAEAGKYLEESKKNLEDSRITSKQILETAKITALNEKNKIIEETKKEVTSMKNKAFEDLEAEKNRLQETLAHEFVDATLLAASKVVEKNISKEDNEKIIDDFLRNKK